MASLSFAHNLGVEVKICTTCGVSKPESEFCKETAKKDGLCSFCRECKRVLRKSHSTVYDPVRQRNNTLKSRYGLSLEEYGHIFSSQDGKCKICQTDLENIIPCVDHCHGTGKVRGILCKSCNSMLGYAKDNTDTLKEAIAYLSST